MPRLAWHRAGTRRPADVLALWNTLHTPVVCADNEHMLRWLQWQLTASPYPSPSLPGRLTADYRHLTFGRGLLVCVVLFADRDIRSHGNVLQYGYIRIQSANDGRLNVGGWGWHAPCPTMTGIIGHWHRPIPRSVCSQQRTLPDAVRTLLCVLQQQSWQHSIYQRPRHLQSGPEERQ